MTTGCGTGSVSDLDLSKWPLYRGPGRSLSPYRIQVPQLGHNDSVSRKIQRLHLD
jgi:hypothetical protein